MNDSTLPSKNFPNVINIYTRYIINCIVSVLRYSNNQHKASFSINLNWHVLPIEKVIL